MIKVYLKNGKELIFDNAIESVRKDDGTVIFFDNDKNPQGIFVRQNIIGWSWSDKDNDKYIPIEELNKIKRDYEYQREFYERQMNIMQKEMDNLQMRLDGKDHLIQSLQDKLNTK